MTLLARAVSVQEILLWRDCFRAEMNCQILHDSMHVRPGWTEPYLLEVDGRVAGYGSILIGGPWVGQRVVFEFYVAPERRAHLFDLFECLLAASKATDIRVQTNDAVLTVMLHNFAREIESENIVFAEGVTTALVWDGAVLCRREVEGDWALAVAGEVAAWGGVLYHYNRPYGDIYMEVAEPFRRRGLGSYFVQEMKRVCRESGSVPCARCSPENVVSRKTLQKAGMVPCAQLLNGKL